MRALAEDMAPEVVTEIDRRLAAAAVEHGVRVPWAIESGSRAWGFPSHDSDYDCRFFFVRPVDDYLDPWPARDVIETPLDAVFDVNGWDLLKAVRLATVGNATVGEWLRSPIVYDGDPAFRDDLLVLVDAVASPAAVARHYQHVALGQWERSGAAAGEACKLKGVFYSLRPAAALHWMSVHDGASPPMNLGQLLEQAPPSGDVVAAVHDLVHVKAMTRELGSGQVPAPIRAFVEEWLGSDLPERLPTGPEPEQARALAADGFRDLARRWG